MGGSHDLHKSTPVLCLGENKGRYRIHMLTQKGFSADSSWEKVHFRTSQEIVSFRTSQETITFPLDREAKEQGPSIL